MMNFGCVSNLLSSRHYYSRFYFSSPLFSFENFLKIFITIYILYFWYLVLLFLLQILLPLFFMKFGWRKRKCLKKCEPSVCKCKCKSTKSSESSKQPEDSQKVVENNVKDKL